MVPFIIPYYFPPPSLKVHLLKLSLEIEPLRGLPTTNSRRDVDHINLQLYIQYQFRTLWWYKHTACVLWHVVRSSSGYTDARKVAIWMERRAMISEKSGDVVCTQCGVQ